MTVLIVLAAVMCAAMLVRRRLHRSKSAHLANVASMRPLADFEARYPRHGRAGRFMR